MFKRITALLCACIMVGVLAACGGTPVATETAETAVSPSGETETTSHIITDVDDGFEDGDFYGELEIARLQVRVKTYWTSVSNYGGNSQKIIDADDSAGYFRYGNVYVIADHNTQEFGGLAYAEKGDIAIITTDGSIETYVCIKAENGINAGHLLDSEYKDYATYDEGTLVIYTCIDDATNVFVTCWRDATDADIAAAETLPELDLHAHTEEGVDDGTQTETESGS